jgi:DNA polymerase I-like protein with 3'-5' exonuclease and polymerase domains/intein/homing endonuclease
LRWWNHRVYDVLTGEFSLDENRKHLNALFFRDKNNEGGTYQLGQLALEYGCQLYAEGAIGKMNRANMAAEKLKDIAAYGGKDVVIPWQIHEFQIAEAKRRGKHYSKFLKTVCEQISDMIITMAMMERNGSQTDPNYLLQQSGNSGHFAQILMLVNRGAPSEGLFGSIADPWVFDIGKPESQSTLFFDVLKLQPLEVKKDGTGKANKYFKKHYKDVPEVKLYSDYAQAKQLKSTFIDSLYKNFLLGTEDGRSDWRIRPSYDYLTIITGRSGSSKPSLQQIPSHGDLAKFLKRVFVASRGKILLKADYKAHEVRNWGNIAGDEIIGAAFRVGLELKQTYRLLKHIDDTVRKEWEEKFEDADVHRINYKFFFGRPTDKIDKTKGKAERQSVKAVVFGVIYGKGAASLAEDIGCTEQQAQELIDLMFSKFVSGGNYINQVKSGIRSDLCHVSPVGRVRHLWGMLHWNKGVHSAQMRRGPNSDIQGFSSDNGFTGNRLMHRCIWEYLESQGQPFSFTAMNMVHDCVKGDTLIPTTKGLIRIDEFVDSNVPGVETVNYTVGSRFGKERATSWIYKGVQDTLKIQTMIGTKLQPTAKHQMLVFNGLENTWVKSGDLKKGDFLCISPVPVTRKSKLSLQLPNYVYKGDPKYINVSLANNKPINKPKYMTPELAYVLGLIVAEGTIAHKRVHMYNCNEKLLDRYEKCARKVFGLETHRYINARKGKPFKVSVGNRTYYTKRNQDCFSSELHSRQLCEWLSHLGLHSKSGKKNGKGAAYHKQIPWSILQADEESQLAFIAAYIEGDACVSKVGETSIYSFSELFIEQMQILLLSHGYFPTIGKGGNSVELSLADTQTLWKRIGKYCAYKFPAKLKKQAVRRKYGLPLALIKAKLEKVGLKSKLPDILLYDSYDKGIYDTALNEIKQADKSLYLQIKSLLKLRYMYTQIKSIRKGKKEKVYDLTIGKGEPSYTVNGMIGHNSNENEVGYVDLPLAAYFLEHSYTTLAHKRLRKVFNHQTVIPFEMDMEMGGSLADTQVWDYSSSQMVQYVEDTIKWQKDNLGYTTDSNKTLKKVESNAIKLEKLRHKEIRLDLKNPSKYASERMLLTPKSLQELDLAYTIPRPQKV